jgi:integrase
MGLRVSEIHAALYGHIDTQPVKDDETGETHNMHLIRVWGKMTRQSKGRGSGEKKFRLVYIDEESFTLLEELKEEYSLIQESYLALKEDGTRYSLSGLRAHITKIARDAGVGVKVTQSGRKSSYVSPHDLRRYWATYLTQVKKVPLPIVMEQGGWGSAQAVQPYQSKATPEILLKTLRDTGVL